MAYRYKSNTTDGWKILGMVVAVLLAIALAFCAVVCVFSAVKGLTFGGVLESWFPPEVVEEAVESTAHLIFKM